MINMENLFSKIIPPKFGSDFNPEPNYCEIFEKYGLIMGRMISYSKSEYSNRNPNNLVVFNGNIFTKKGGKIWFGDLDVTLDFDNLKEIADELGEDLYILREMDGRFENEKRKFKEIKEVAVTVIKHK